MTGGGAGRGILAGVRAGGVAIGVALVTVPLAVEAQSATQTQLTIVAGQATDALGGSASAVTVAPAIMFRPSTRLAADVGLEGTRFANSQWSASVTGGIGVDLPVARWLAFTASGGGAYTTTAHDAHYTSVSVLPALELRASRYVAFAGMQAARGTSRLPEAIAGGAPLPIGGQPAARGVTTERSLLGAVFGGGVRFAATEGSGYAGYREERSDVAGARLVDRSLAATIAAGRVAYGVSVGTRQLADSSELFASGSVTVDVVRGAALQLAGSRYPANPLTGAVGGSAVSVGVVLRAGRPPAARFEADRATRVRGVPAPARGARRLVMRAPRAARVEIAGDWNDWRPVPALRAPDGTWYADVRLRPGRYRYAFRIDGDRWAVPEGVAAVDDGFGGRSAWLTVN